MRDRPRFGWSVRHDGGGDRDRPCRHDPPRQSGDDDRDGARHVARGRGRGTLSLHCPDRRHECPASAPSAKAHQPSRPRRCGACGGGAPCARPASACAAVRAGAARPERLCLRRLFPRAGCGRLRLWSAGGSAGRDPAGRSPRSCVHCALTNPGIGRRAHSHHDRRGCRRGGGGAGHRRGAGDQRGDCRGAAAVGPRPRARDLRHEHGAGGRHLADRAALPSRYAAGPCAPRRHQEDRRQRRPPARHALPADVGRRRFGRPVLCHDRVDADRRLSGSAVNHAAEHRLGRASHPRGSALRSGRTRWRLSRSMPAGARSRRGGSAPPCCLSGRRRA